MFLFSKLKKNQIRDVWITEDEKTPTFVIISNRNSNFFLSYHMALRSYCNGQFETNISPPALFYKEHCDFFVSNFRNVAL